MSEKPADIAQFVSHLNEHGVRHVIIGGIAMVLHGSSHVTDDVDFAVARDPKSLGALAAALLPLRPRLRGAPADLQFTLDERFLRNTVNLTLDTGWGAFDLLGDVPGSPPFDELLARSVTETVSGVEVRIASLTDLVAMKRAANRPKDQLHLVELEALIKLQAREES